MSEINDTLKEALKNGMAVVIYQTEKGPSIGFIETKAITAALAETVNGDDKYATAMMTATGGSVDKADDFLDGVVKSLVGLWAQVREVFVSE